MSILASELIAKVTVMGAKQAMADLRGVGAESESAGGLLGKSLMIGGALAATAIATIGVVSLKMAGDFEQATNTLVTSAGLQRSSLNAVRQGILKMSVDTGTSTDQLVKGMFNVQSALHLGAGGLQVLKAAAEGAKAENSDLAQTTDVLTTAMVNYHLGAQQAVGTMNSLIVTVAAGKMHMNDLTGSLKNVLPVSASLKVKLSDVEGALATMANAGDRGTSAGTHLAMMFKMLSNPIGAAKSEMAAMGLNSVDLANTMRTSLPEALQMIQDAVAQHFVPGSVEYQRAIMTILGGSKSGIAGLEIFGQGMKQLQQNTDDAAAALRRGGKDVDNWTVIQSGLNFQLDRAHRALDALLIQLGMKLLPAVTPLVAKFADFAGQLANLNTKGLDVFASKAQKAASSIWNALSPSLQDVWDTGQHVAGVLSDMFVQIGKSGEVDKLGTSFLNLATNMQPLIKNLGDATKGMADFVNQTGLIPALFKEISDETSQFFNGTADQLKQVGPVMDVLRQLSHTNPFDPVSWAEFGYVVDKARKDLDNLNNTQKKVADPKTLTLAQQEWQKWLNYISAGGTKSFDDFQAADNRATENFLKNQAKMHPAIDQTRKHLEDINRALDSNAAASNRATEAFLRDQARMHPAIDETRKHLEQLNGPFTPKVRLNDLALAVTEADAAYWHLQRLNGTSVWTSYLNQVTIGAPSPTGGPRAHASGILDNPVGHWASLAEQGGEWMYVPNPTMGYVPKGASVLPHGITPASGASSSGTSNQPIVLVMDGQVVARGLMPHITNQIRYSTGVRF